MPDPILLGQSFALSALLAAAVVLLFAWPWRAASPRRTSLALVLAMAGALAFGCWWTDVWPHWPPLEDPDRLLLLLLPALLAVETLAAVLPRLRLVWPLRLLVAAAATPILLYNSEYVADLSGPGSRKWTLFQTNLVFFCCWALLSFVWGSLAGLQRRGQSRAVPLALALVCAGATATVMLSGYATVGPIGVALTAAIVGTALASLLLPAQVPLDGVVSLGVVGLFALLVVGRYFGNLFLERALALVLAPLLCWLPELPYANRLTPRWRGAVPAALTTVPVALTLLLAKQQFDRASAPSVPTATGEPSLQDYFSYGK